MINKQDARRWARKQMKRDDEPEPPLPWWVRLLLLAGLVAFIVRVWWLM